MNFFLELIVLIRSGLVAAAIVLSPAPALAAHNLIVNGSFETGDFSGFTHLNEASNTPAIVLKYNNAAAYGQGGGAFGEAVPVDDSLSPGNDGAGQHAAYFVSDFSTNEALTQRTGLHVGNYEIGFSAYLPYNGIANANDATFDASIIGVDVTHFSAAAQAATTGAGHWVNYSGVASVVKNGYYLTAFTYSSFGLPAKDVVIDRVFAAPTTRAATFAISPTQVAALPEPATWGLMIVGFGLVGFSARCRNSLIAGRTGT